MSTIKGQFFENLEGDPDFTERMEKYNKYQHDYVRWLKANAVRCEIVTFDFLHKVTQTEDLLAQEKFDFLLGTPKKLDRKKVKLPFLTNKQNIIKTPNVQNSHCEFQMTALS
ncbi:hypothetical protein QJS10_CPA10g01730 [Acorus calamus]|uniref:Uncharacterized protein n=1 Tax=Acorus calamus TaxID=4465 RepID=A0AAV9DXM6_ACOCL|nr:hypothetical protein QJS10_CPA10g01730 [Acorus calamus]